MARQNRLLRCRIRILYRNESTTGEEQHAPHHRCTCLPEASHLLFLWKPMLLSYGYLHSARNTMKTLPTEALCSSHVLPAFHKPDKLYLPSFRFPQVEILLFLSVHKNLLPATSMEADLPVPELLHNPDNVQSGLALPSNAGARIPSHVICNSLSLYRFHALQ